MKRFLVTGGAGFIGAAITQKLLDQKNFVRVLDNEFRGNTKTFHAEQGQTEFITADIRDLTSVTDACRNIDTIIHLAFINGTKNFYEKPDLVLSVGVKGMLNILDAAELHNVPELFVASSSEVYQNPPVVPTPEDVPLVIPSAHNPRYSYAGGKIISELLTIHNGKRFKKAVIFRPHNVYGPAMGYEHVIPAFIKRMHDTQGNEISFPIQGSGKETRSFIYIDDFVDGLLLLLEKGEHLQIYHIGTDHEIAISELARKIASLMNKKIKLTHEPLPDGSTPRRCPDITKMKKLGFSPLITLDQGLQKTIDTF